MLTDGSVQEILVLNSINITLVLIICRSADVPNFLEEEMRTLCNIITQSVQSNIEVISMQVLNGLLSRDDADQACTTPIGIIPAGSDNSLVWTVLGVRDPTTAALAIVKV